MSGGVWVDARRCGVCGGRAWVCKCAVGSGEETGEVLTSAFSVPSISVLHLSKVSVLSIIHRLAFQGYRTPEISGNQAR